MKVPAAERTQYLKKPPTPLVKECLEYVAYCATQANGISYDDKEKLITYHYQVQPDDVELFEYLYGIQEVWILTGIGSES